MHGGPVPAFALFGLESPSISTCFNFAPFAISSKKAPLPGVGFAGGGGFSDLVTVGGGGGPQNNKKADRNNQEHD